MECFCKKYTDKTRGSDVSYNSFKCLSCETKKIWEAIPMERKIKVKNLYKLTVKNNPTKENIFEAGNITSELNQYGLGIESIPFAEQF